MTKKLLYVVAMFIAAGFFIFGRSSQCDSREKTLINDGWSFYKYADNENPDRKSVV